MKHRNKLLPGTDDHFREQLLVQIRDFLAEILRRLPGETTELQVSLDEWWLKLWRDGR